MKPHVSESPYYIETLARGLDVLRLFSRERPNLSMSDVVELTDLSKATAYRILWTLEAVGYLVRDEYTKRYRPGIPILQLGFTAINNMDVRQVAHTHLQSLAQELDLTASLSVLDGMSAVYLDRVRNRAIYGVLLNLGDRIPAHCSSMGKVMLAHLPQAELEERLAEVNELAPCTARSITTVQQLTEELKQVREQGYATNDGELYSGLRAIAAPILDQHRRAVAALNVSGGIDDISEERLQVQLPPRVKQTAQLISQSLSVSESIN